MTTTPPILGKNQIAWCNEKYGSAYHRKPKPMVETKGTK